MFLARCLKEGGCTITMNKQLESEFQYYLDHQDELVNKYNGKVLVIKGGAVIGVHDSEIQAVEETKTRA